MQERSESEVLDALLVAFRPIAKALLLNGIGYRELNEIARTAFVDVATSEYGIRGRPTNISRVAVMTGLTRKEVRRIRDKINAGTEAVVAKSTPLANVLQTWHTDDDFLDQNGRPRALQFDGESPSFATIVKRAGGDIPPGAMRTELKRINAIEELEDGSLRPLKRHTTTMGREQTLINGLTRGLYPLAVSIARNVQIESANESWLQRTVSTDSVRNADTGRLRRISHDRLEEFTDAIDDLYAAYETLHSSDTNSEGIGTIGIGVFYFEE